MSTGPRTDEVVVGRIGRPHGIRGEVTVELRTDEPERRFADGAVLLGPAAPAAGRPRRTPTLTVAAHPLAPGPAARALRASSPTAPPPRRRAGWTCSTVGRPRRAARGPRGVLRPPAGRPRRGHHRRAPRSAWSPRSCTPAPRTCSSCAARAATTRWCRSCRAGARGRPRRRTAASSPTVPGCSSRSRRTEPGAHRRRVDLPRLPRAARPLAARQGRGQRAARPARPRPPRLDPRPAPHRRRHARTAAAPAWS